jgi:hypothetical protein
MGAYFATLLSVAIAQDFILPYTGNTVEEVWIAWVVIIFIILSFYRKSS